MGTIATYHYANLYKIIEYVPMGVYKVSVFKDDKLHSTKSFTKADMYKALVYFRSINLKTI